MFMSYILDVRLRMVLDYHKAINSLKPLKNK